MAKNHNYHRPLFGLTQEHKITKQDRAVILIGIIADNPDCTLAEICLAMDWTKPATQPGINWLCKMGYITRKELQIRAKGNKPFIHRITKEGKKHLDPNRVKVTLRPKYTAATLPMRVNYAIN